MEQTPCLPLANQQTQVQAKTRWRKYQPNSLKSCVGKLALG